MRKFAKVLLVLAMVCFGLTKAMATDPTATDIITAATTAFGLVATLCVSIGTFFVVYKLVRKVR